jgi:hypothetical protein
MPANEDRFKKMCFRIGQIEPTISNHLQRGPNLQGFTGCDFYQLSKTGKPNTRRDAATSSS